MTKIEKALKWMMEIADDDVHGYDQEHRNGPDYDCSSFVATGLYTAGFDVDPKSWTGNLYKQLINCGFTPVSGERKKGDIYLTPGVHVAFCVDSSRLVHARINEKGTITGGKTGDQTGQEICISPFYTPKEGWKYHLRYVEEKTERSLKPLRDIVEEVCDGKWGRSTKREQALTEAGYYYPTIRAAVNKKMNKLPSYDYDTVAKEINSGKWGDGEERIEKLVKQGIDPIQAQMVANALLV